MPNPAAFLLLDLSLLLWPTKMSYTGTVIQDFYRDFSLFGQPNQYLLREYLNRIFYRNVFVLMTEQISYMNI
jgi:hypothetical protein